jgi:hypothetical protein
MTKRSIFYWLICTIFAVLVAHSSEPVTSDLTWRPLEADAAHVSIVPEPARAMMLFAGIMAMAFTYRRAWMNWKVSTKG